MRYILVVVMALSMFLPAKADSLVTISLEARGVGGQSACYSGTITTPAAGGEILEFCVGANGVATIQLPAWTPYRLVEKVPAGYSVSRIECVGASKYRAGGASVTVNVEGDSVACTFSHVRKTGGMPRVIP